MLVICSGTIRAVGSIASRRVRSSYLLTVWITRPASGPGNGSTNGRHGVSTSRSPSQRRETSGSSSYVPTARVVTSWPWSRSHWVLRASRPSVKP